MCAVKSKRVRTEEAAETLHHPYSLLPVDESLPGDPGFVSPERHLQREKKEEEREKSGKRAYVLSPEGRQNIVMSNRARENRGGGGGLRRDRLEVEAILMLLSSDGKIGPVREAEVTKRASFAHASSYAAPNMPPRRSSR